MSAISDEGEEGQSESIVGMEMSGPGMKGRMEWNDDGMSKG